MDKIKSKDAYSESKRKEFRDLMIKEKESIEKKDLDSICGCCVDTEKVLDALEICENQLEDIFKANLQLKAELVALKKKIKNYIIILNRLIKYLILK